LEALAAVEVADRSQKKTLVDSRGNGRLEPRSETQVTVKTPARSATSFVALVRTGDQPPPHP
jgi:hypothetical protein